MEQRYASEDDKTQLIKKSATIYRTVWFITLFMKVAYKLWTCAYLLC
jgi:hypothetical protein